MRGFPAAAAANPHGFSSTTHIPISRGPGPVVFPANRLSFSIGLPANFECLFRQRSMHFVDCGGPAILRKGSAPANFPPTPCRDPLLFAPAHEVQLQPAFALAPGFLGGPPCSATGRY